MTLIPIKLPPGMHKNGTLYEAQGRWGDGNYVRWHNGSLRAIGGWEYRIEVVSQAPMPSIVADPSLEVVRSINVWGLNDGSVSAAFGSNLGLYYMDPVNMLSTITPDAFVPGPSVPSDEGGYGDGVYGAGSYGTPRTSTGIVIPPLDHWDFSNWGEELMACRTAHSSLYSYKAGEAKAIVVPNAPTDISGVTVTNERIVMVIGSDIEPRTVRWSDRENRELWAPALANYAGDTVLEGSGKLLTIDNVLNQTLILSEDTAHIARFIGAPYIFRFDKVGTGCGPISGDVVITTSDFAIWIGAKTMWMYDGAIKPVPCSVMDFLIRDIDVATISKTVGGSNDEYSEVWWLYQSKTSATGEVDSYVTFDHLEGHWTTGKIDRTALHDRGGLARPIMVTHEGIIYNHELAENLPEGAYAETGPLEMANGTANVAVRYLFPDSGEFGDSEYRMYGKSMPTDPEIEYGPFPYNNPISTTGVMGRSIRIRVDLLGANAEVGINRIDISPQGTGIR